MYYFKGNFSAWFISLSLLAVVLFIHGEAYLNPNTTPDSFLLSNILIAFFLIAINRTFFFFTELNYCSRFNPRTGELFPRFQNN